MLGGNVPSWNAKVVQLGTEKPFCSRVSRAARIWKVLFSGLVYTKEGRRQFPALFQQLLLCWFLRMNTTTVKRGAFNSEIVNQIVSNLEGLIQLQVQKIRWWQSGLISHKDSQLRNMPFINLKKVQRHHHFDASGVWRVSWKVSDEFLGGDETYVCKASHNYPLKITNILR